MLSLKCLLFGCSPFISAANNWGGLCKKGNCTFPLRQLIENSISLSLEVLSLRSSNHTLAKHFSQMQDELPKSMTSDRIHKHIK